MSTSTTTTEHRDRDTAAELQRQREAIASTRAEVGRTLEHLEHRVSPTQIRERQKERMRSRWGRVKDAVMGGEPQDGSLGERVTDAAEQAREHAQHAPEQLEQAARGNPIAAGMIAAGLGALVGSLLPPTRPEQQLGHRLHDEFGEPLRDELREAGHQMGEELRDDVRDRADSVEHTAREAVDHARETADEAREQLSTDDPQRGETSAQDRDRDSGSQPSHHDRDEGPLTPPIPPQPRPSPSAAAAQHRTDPRPQYDRPEDRPSGPLSS